MILKKSAIAVIFYIAWSHGISGSSYSKVYVNMGTKANPYQYISYGAPPVTYGPTLSELSAPPVQSVPPSPQPARFAPPCVIPCVPVVPEQTVSQYDTNAPIIGYTVPNAPIVVSGNAPSNYQYSYVVYDDRTGDQKAASESSDAGYVRGRYSFLQPDGYVREVQYTADDVTGFNAVVNYLPAAGGDQIVEVKGILCPDPNPEALKQDTSENQPVEKSSTTTASPSIQVVTVSPKETLETTKSPNDEPTEESATTADTPETTTDKTSEETTETPTTPVEDDRTEEYVVVVSSSLEVRTTTPSPETTTPKAMDEKPTTISMEETTTEAATTMSPENTPITSEIPTTTIQDVATIKEKAEEQPTTAAPSVETVTAKVTKEEPKTEKKVPAVVTPIEAPQPVIVQSVQPQQPAVVQLLQPPQSTVVQSYPAPQPAYVQFVPAPQPAPTYYTNSVPAGYVSYDQLLKCIQKMQIANQQAVNSPLTYILLPSNAKPC